MRRGHDAYPTPVWCVHRLLEAVPLPGGRWLEPSAGDGAIIRAVNAVRSDVEWTAVELRSECAVPLVELVRPPGRVAIADFETMHSLGYFDVAILNPPFVFAREFIAKCLQSANTICALERLNWLEGEARNGLLRECPPDVYVLPNRPSFTGRGTDSIAYAWFVWGPERRRDAGRIVVLPTTPAAERRANKVLQTAMEVRDA